MWLMASIHSDPDASQKPQIATYHPYMPEPESPVMSSDGFAALMRSIGIGNGKGNKQ